MKKIILMIMSAAALSCAVSTYASDANDTEGYLIYNQSDIQWEKNDQDVTCASAKFPDQLAPDSFNQITTIKPTPCTARYQANDGEITIIWTGSQLEASSTGSKHVNVSTDDDGVAVFIQG